MDGDPNLRGNVTQRNEEQGVQWPHSQGTTRPTSPDSREDLRYNLGMDTYGIHMCRYGYLWDTHV